MISTFREFTKSWIFKGLMVLLVVSFAVFGFQNVFSPSTSTDVVTAGNRTISNAEFKMRFENFKRNYEQQGQTFTNEEFVEAGQHTRMLNELADQAAFSAWLDTLGVKPSAKLLLDEIAKIPAFFNTLTGRFDQDTYKQALLGAQMSVETFEADTRDQIAVTQYLDAAQAGLKAPRVFAAVNAAFTLQSRDASIFLLSPQNVANPAAPTPADIDAYYKDNQQRFNLPELRTASVVTFSSANYAKDIPVSDEDLRKLYEARRASLATPETRSFVQITAPDMAAANKISTALKAGRSPEDAAKANKGEVISYTLKPKSAVADAKVGEAAFKLQTGEISGAIQGDLSVSVVKMGEVKIGSAPSFEVVREQLAQDIRKERAADKLNEVTNAFSDALNKGEDFEAAAARLGVKVAQLEPMTAEGRGAAGGNYSTYEPLVKGIFDLQQVGSTSDVESLAEGEYFALKLTGIKPAGPPPLNEIRNDLAALWMREKMEAAINAEADKAVARLAKGETIAAVAASYKTQVQPLKGVTRQNAQQMQLPQQLMAKVFTSKAGENFRAEMPIPTQQGQIPAVAIGRLDAVTQADATQTSSVAAMTSQQVTQMVAQDVASLTRASARATIKTKTHPNAALRELGVALPEPDATKAGDSKAGDTKAKS